MPRLTHPENGFHYCSDEEAIQMIKDGWKVITAAEWDELLKNKRMGNAAETTEAPRPILGRPKKA